MKILSSEDLFELGSENIGMKLYSWGVYIPSAQARFYYKTSKCAFTWREFKFMGVYGSQIVLKSSYGNMQVSYKDMFWKKIVFLTNKEDAFLWYAMKRGSIDMDVVVHREPLGKFDAYIRRKYPEEFV